MEGFDDAYLSEVDDATVRAIAVVSLALGVPSVIAAIVLGAASLVMRAGIGAEGATELAAVSATLGFCLVGLCGVLYLSLTVRSATAHRRGGL